MSDGQIHALTMPKWGMAMDEGTVTAWHVAEGAAVEAGVELLDVESTKIANAIEAKQAGILRRCVAAVGDTLPVVEKTIGTEQIARYARASGDHNPIHLDPEFAATSQFGGIVAHGMLTRPSFPSPCASPSGGTGWRAGS